MKLTGIKLLEGKIVLKTGLHIGAGNDEITIGGSDQPVVKNILTGQPYIPGSSIKGKMRSMLEWHLGAFNDKGGAADFSTLKKDRDNKNLLALLKLFGGSADTKNDTEIVKEVGPARLSFWDCEFTSSWLEANSREKMTWFETKYENTINRVSGTAEHPRNIERVPAGAEFDFKLTIKEHDDENLEDMIFYGLKLIEMTGLGGGLSRGNGKVKFENLTIDGVSAQDKLDNAKGLA